VSDQVPSRAVAAILAFALPPGVGQAYLGLSRRAVTWFVSFVLLGLAVPLAMPALGAALGYRTACLLYVVAVAARWIAPLIDVLALKQERFDRTKTPLLVGLAVGGVIAALFANALPTRLLLLESFKVPGGSMIPTLLVGDRIFVDKLVYRTRAPRAGEVMVFAFPENHEQDFIKRVILMPGNTLEVKDGHPWINGWEVPHCKVGTFSYGDPDTPSFRHGGELDVEFLGEQAYLTLYDTASGGLTDRGPFIAKPDEYWVMGDNRNNSHDSPTWFGGRGGGVPRGLVRGHALSVWTGATDAGLDWSRAGQAIEGPTLPNGSESLRGALDACMKARPPSSQTTPPPPT
jgi:signal peptidase I